MPLFFIRTIGTVNQSLKERESVFETSDEKQSNNRRDEEDQR